MHSFFLDGCKKFFSCSLFLPFFALFLLILFVFQFPFLTFIVCTQVVASAAALAADSAAALVAAADSVVALAAVVCLHVVFI